MAVEHFDIGLVLTQTLLDATGALHREKSIARPNLDADMFGRLVVAQQRKSLRNVPLDVVFQLLLGPVRCQHVLFKRNQLRKNPVINLRLHTKLSELASIDLVVGFLKLSLDDVGEHPHHCVKYLFLRVTLHLHLQLVQFFDDLRGRLNVIVFQYQTG